MSLYVPIWSTFSLAAIQVGPGLLCVFLALALGSTVSPSLEGQPSVLLTLLGTEPLRLHVPGG